MAGQTKATIDAALATLVEKKCVGLINRACPTLQMLPKIPADSKNVTWDIVSGDADNASSIAIAEDGTISTGNKDTPAMAYLPYRVYAEPFSYTGLAQAVARAAGGPDDLANIEMFELDRASSRFGAGVSNHLFSGNTAANPGQINGLITASTGALLATGTYATVDKGVTTQFAGNVIDASTEATGGALSLPLMRKMISYIVSRDEQSRAPTFIAASNRCFDTYCNMFDAQRRWVNEITLGSRTFKLDGGVQIAEFDGIPVVRDVKIPETTTGKMLFIQDQEVRIRYLPFPTAQDIMTKNIEISSDGKHTLSRGTGLIAKIIKMGKTGDFDLFALVAYLQAQVRAPNSCGYMHTITLT
jgi:hypothetical protein